MPDIQEGIDRMRKAVKDNPVNTQETVHYELDQIILEFLPKEIKDEYIKIEDEVGGFWYS